MVNVTDIEKHIEDSLVKGLRVLFTESVSFTFNTDKALSKVHISMGKPRTTESDKPAVFVTGISYSVSDIGMADGEVNDVVSDTGKIIGYTRASKVSFNASIMCTHEKSPISKNLSNEVLFHLWFTGKNFLSLAFKTKINNINKSANGRKNISENRSVYIETISLSGECYIETKFTDAYTTDVLNRIEASYKDEFGNQTRFDVY